MCAWGGAGRNGAGGATLSAAHRVRALSSAVALLFFRFCFLCPLWSSVNDVAMATAPADPTTKSGMGSTLHGWSMVRGAGAQGRRATRARMGS